MALLDEVKEVVAAELDCDIETITPESKFIEDLNADSLDVVELVMALEEKFDLEIPDEDSEKIASVADVVAYIEEHKE